MMTITEIIGRLQALAEHGDPAKLETKSTAMWRETCRQAAGKLAAEAPRPEAACRDELRKLVEAVEKWDDDDSDDGPDDLTMIEACVKARQFLDSLEPQSRST